jgi:hypothetical protein
MTTTTTAVAEQLAAEESGRRPDAVTISNEIAFAPPTVKLAHLTRLMRDLGCDVSPFGPAEELVRRTGALQRLEFERTSAAATARREIEKQVADDPDALNGDAAAAWAAAGVWLDRTHGDQSAGVALAKQAGRLLEQRIGLALATTARHVFDEARKKVAAVVAEVEALPKFPDGIWQLDRPDRELPRWREHRTSWGTLSAAWQDWTLAHALADSVRNECGYGLPPDGAPRSAFAYRNWRTAVDDNRFYSVKGPLRLRLAIEANWQPGCWTPADIKVTAGDKTPASRLKRLGSAVFKASGAPVVPEQ